MVLGVAKTSLRYDAAQRACRDGDVKTLTWLLDHGSLFENAAGLRRACKTGEWGTGKAEVRDDPGEKIDEKSDGEKVDITESYSTTDSIRLHELLKTATTRGHVKVVQTLLERFPARGLHVLEWEVIVNAIAQGDVSLLNPFVEVDPDLVNMYKPSFGTCFSAVFSLVDDKDLHLDVVAFLLDRGADIQARGDVLLREAVQSSSPAVLSLLVSKGAVGDPLKMLREACEFGNESMVEYLLASGADVDQVNDSGSNFVEGQRAGDKRTALQIATVKGHQTIVDLLSRHGAELSLQS